MAGEAQLIDTFPTFLEYWDGTKEGWLGYISRCPELFEKITWDYERYKINWKEYLEIVIKKIEIEKLRAVHNALMSSLEEVLHRAHAMFDINEDYIIVIYIGLENGAGWVTEFKGKPAILFGLEAIANLDWAEKVKGLIAHEFGHLVHWLIRGENIEEIEDEQIMWLYTEGFAQRIEDILTGRPWHLEEEGWFEWCERNEEMIKQEFLRRIENREPLNPFFGSWYQVFGKQFLGYYLGYKFIVWLERQYELTEIARLKKNTIKEKIMEFLTY